jgi:anti-anti-sigma factor
MHATALVRIDLAGPPSPTALRMLLRFAHRLRRLPGFRHWQTFRELGPADALYVLTDWDSTEALTSALSESVLDPLRSAAVECGCVVSPVEQLVPSFDRQLTPRPPVASLLRVSQPRAGFPEAAARDSDFALRTLAAPGTTRISGTRSADGRSATCRIDFDNDDGLWGFEQSPLRGRWSKRARQALEAEHWCINLPRLEYRRLTSRALQTVLPPRPQGTLSVQFTVSDDRSEAHLWLQGEVDAHGSEWCEKLCQILLSDGCCRLEVDVSDLKGISAAALGMLTRTARALKARGGQFILTDNEERVRRVTRTKHLETSVR